MSEKINIDQFEKEVEEEINNWKQNEFKEATNKSYKETAKEVVKTLKEGGPYEERTGAYTKGWTSSETGKRTGAITGLTGYSVHNKKHYRLTHLLENGHQSRNGQRVKAYSHIAAVQEKSEKILVNKIKQNMER